MKDKMTVKSDSTKKNFSFQLTYQVIILFIPLIISPYLTRVLGKTALGDYTFTYSIMCYFSIFAQLGIYKYGQRIIAENKDDIDKLRTTFWSLFLTHLIISALSISIYSIFLVLSGEEFRTLYFIHFLVLLSTAFDITWFFYGIEQFKGVVIKNAIIKIVELVLIFILVKDSGDIYIYAIIMGASVLAGMLILIPSAIKKVPPIKVTLSDCKTHVKPLFVLFIAALASVVYSIFDKTLLGIMTTTDNVAFYEYANKIILVPRSIAIVIGTIMYPKACVLLKNNNFEKQKQLFGISTIFVNYISFGSIFGLLAVGNLFSIIYYGNDFAICGVIMMALSPTIFTVSFAEIIRSEYLMPLHKDKEYVIGQIIAVILNVVVSIILIYYLDIYGAILGSVVSEIFVMVYQTVICRKYIEFKSIFKHIIVSLFCALIMFGLIELIKLFYNDGIWALLVQVISGFAAYTLLFAIYYLCFSKEKNMLLKIIRKRKGENKE